MEEFANKSPRTHVDAEPELIESLFREHNHALLRLLTARVGSMEVAQEIAQEAYTKLLLSQGKLSSVRSHKAYLFRIAQNLATDYLRHETIIQNHARANIVEEAPVSPGPARSLVANQELELLQKAISELPAKCRMAFKLHRHNGLAVAEVAQRINLSERMVRNHISRALAYCQSRLDELNGKTQQ